MDTRIVLDIDDELRRRLEARARLNHRTLEEEALDILNTGGMIPFADDPELPLGSRIARLFSGSGIGFRDGEIQELRSGTVQTPDFRE